VYKDKTSLTQFEKVFQNPGYVKVYDKLDVNYQGLYSRSALSLAKQAKVQAGSTVLELGAGTGFATKVLNNLVGLNGKVIATEISPAMIKYLKRKFFNQSNIEIFQLDVKELKEFLDKHFLKGKLDVVFGNFIYYYLYKYEREWFESAYQALKDNGRLAFNITNFLSEFTYRGKVYNNFLQLMKLEFEILLKESGFAGGLGKRVGKEFIKEESLNKIRESLHQVGFRKISISPFSLPVRPSQALKFMIEGFYRFGSSVSWSTTLADLQLKKRVKILENGLKRVASKIDSTKDNSTIMNFVASK